MAMNCCVVALAMHGLVGASEIDTSVASVTVITTTLLLIVLFDAVMLLVPFATACASPVVGSMVTLAVVADCQVTWPVMSMS